MSLKGSSAVSNLEVPDRHRRRFHRRGNGEKGRGEICCFPIDESA